jgi:hypothetical protein
MIRSAAVLAVAGIALSGCQTPDPRYVHTDRDCLNRQVGSRVLSTAAGIAVGLVAGPAGGLVGIGVGAATDPRCRVHTLTPEGREQIRREVEEERRLVRRGDVRREPIARPVLLPPSGRPLDGIPSSTPTPAN